jgi:cyclophilin family peptidyl-prolyl cis-trans isomerase
MAEQRYEQPPEMTIDPEREYRAVLRTERGEIRLRLLPEVAPVTVNNFVFLAREGFYDGCTFHRVIPGFVAQTGDPGGTGRGGPGYRIQDELNDLAFEPGTVGMANAGPNTNGSQFYLVLDDAPHLNGRYTAFARIEEGLEVARSLRPRDPASDSQPGDRLESVEIVEG